MQDDGDFEYPVTLMEFTKLVPFMDKGYVPLTRYVYGGTTRIIDCSVAKKGSAYTLTFKVPE
jgi:hypothetical protein